ncbi:SCO7613 C-terminal domain-containing membrane protein [Streptomyces sp. NPDC021224]|uniref:SCO7613 C-terminal domain-containing membrane protein n=1 Tax=unclassified Streptomyces TaxID=2593676 RepID=UPI0037BE0358
MPLVGGEVVELGLIAAELRGIAARQAVLVQRRAALLAVLRGRRADVAGVPVPDAGARSAQTLLLTLGGSLLTLAGLVFTLVSWGRFGIGARTAVLAVLTLAVLAAPFPLRRRALAATAETASAVGLALVLLDAYAARAAGLAGLDGVRAYGYWAAVTGLAAAGAAAYARLSRSELLPYAAVLLLQLPAPLTAGYGHAHATGLAYALLVSAGVDLAVAARLRARVPGPFAFGAAAVGAAAGGLLAGAAAYSFDSYGPALRACVPLLLAAALGLAAAGLRAAAPPVRTVTAALAGLALLAAAAVAPHLALPHAWLPLAWAGPAALLAAVAFALPPRRGHGPVALGLSAAGAFALAAAGVSVLPDLLRALTEPLRGAPDFPGTWHVTGTVATVAALVAAVAAGAAVRFRAVALPLWCGAAVATVAAAVTAPVAAGAPYAVAVAVPTALALAATAALVRTGPAGPAGPHLPPPWGAGPAAALCALLAAGAVALGWSLARDGAALTVWGIAAVVAGGAAAARRFVLPAGTVAVAALGYEAARAAHAAGLPSHLAAFAVLGIALATVPVAGAAGAGAEYAGYVLGAVAVTATAGHPQELSLALALAGAGAAGTALRAERRRAAATAAALLLSASLWVQLALAEVHAPEPYTVGPSAVLLALGHLRRRRAPALGSWPAYGPGLCATLLPSLVAVWAQPHGPRPLLLGAAALTVTLLGARHRLRAPLVTGGLVLLADAAHELAPAVLHSLAHVPHWAPVALAGGLLVYVGATYERRLAEARRLRSTFHSLH